MTLPLIEGLRPGEGLVDEVSQHLSRSKIELKSGTHYQVNQLLSENTSTGVYEIWNPSGANGTEIAAAILFNRVDATSEQKPGTGFVALTAFQEEKITWPDSVTDEQKKTAIKQLTAKHIRLV